MGTTRDEGLFTLAFLHRDSAVLRQALQGDLEAWASGNLLCGEGLTKDTTTEPPLQVAEKIRTHVLGAGGDPTSALIEFFSDRFFTLGSSTEAKLASRLVPVYQYVVDHTGPGQMRFSDMIGIAAPAMPLVSHGDDQAYLFRSATQARPEPGSPEHAIVRLFVKLWTSFARRGYPAAPELGLPDWPIYTAPQAHYLRLNSKPTVAEKAFEERLRFWESLPLREPWNAHQWTAERTGHDEL